MKQPKIVASIEARMSASRLPGKVLKNVCGIPTLAHMVRRLKRSAFIQDVVIATTTNPKDQAICELAAREKVGCFQGSEEDVLARVCDCHKGYGTDIVVELTGDCPLIDVYWVDRAIEKFLEGKWDFVSNCIPMTFPRGLDCKVFAFKDLQWMADSIADNAVREHVSLYFYEVGGRYTLGVVEAPQWLRYPEYRWTLDTQEDFEFITQVYDALYQKNNYFSSWDIIHFLNKNPHIVQINTHIEQKPIRQVKS
jgi:spore coat polysaccharide biosynthesis protein SpsF